MQKIPHLENVGDKWAPLLVDVQKELPAVVNTIIKEGGTRKAWHQIKDNQETILMAYPAESLLKASAVMQGVHEKKLDVVHAVPLLEGIPNYLLILNSYPWKNNVAADVLIHNPAIEKSFWVHNPLYYNDKDDLRNEQPQTVMLSGLVYGIRKALLDDITITSGEAYEKYAIEYLAANPDKSRLDVPPLKRSLQGVQVISLGKNACEYHARAVVRNLQSFDFGPEGAKVKIYSFILNLATEEQPMPVVFYASEKTLMNGLVLEEGMDIDFYFWLQGRVVETTEEVQE